MRPIRVQYLSMWLVGRVFLAICLGYIRIKGQTGEQTQVFLNQGTYLPLFVSTYVQTELQSLAIRRYSTRPDRRSQVRNYKIPSSPMAVMKFAISYSNPSACQSPNFAPWRAKEEVVFLKILINFYLTIILIIISLKSSYMPVTYPSTYLLYVSNIYNLLLMKVGISVLIIFA